MENSGNFYSEKIDFLFIIIRLYIQKNQRKIRENRYFYQEKSEKLKIR